MYLPHWINLKKLLNGSVILSCSVLSLMARLKNYESSKEQGSRKNLNTPSSKWNLRDNYRQSNMTWQWAIKMGRGFQWSDMAN